MTRYVSGPRPRAFFYDDDPPLVPDLTVDDHDMVDTGLLDGDGNVIWRAPNPMGFGRDDEW
mgnify:FL=1